MSLAITNASLLLGRELEYVEQGYIEIENGKIRSTAAGSYKGSGKKLDAKGFMVIPGFINAHTHIADSIGKEDSAKESARASKELHQEFCNFNDEKGNSCICRFSRRWTGGDKAPKRCS
jgi:cytosine/adenosine deaminase-related metal-dependent hydrolase